LAQNTMSRLCIVLNDNKPDYFGAALGGWCTILALGNLVAVFVGSKRREEEIIYCLPFAGIYLAQISSEQR